MKSLLLLFLLCAVLAQSQSPTPTCQCPQVRCDGSDAAKLCQCLNEREIACKRRCPEYTPTTLACPTNSRPTATLVPAPQPIEDGACECEERMCAQMWPQSCHCTNANKQACYEKCGGVRPALANCPSPDPEPPITPERRSSSPTTSTITLKRTLTTATPILPRNTHEPCGGLSPNAPTCDPDSVCIRDPYRSGCGPACDEPGICVLDRICGGFAGFGCLGRGQVCWDDERDDCVEGEGGNDCAGLCVWPH